MKILVITTEIGNDCGGLSLSCLRIVEMLSIEHEVFVANSTDYSIITANGSINIQNEIGIQKEYKLKQDCLKYKDIEVVIGFSGKYNGYYASLLAERIHARFILSLRGSDINITKWSVDDSWYLKETIRKASKIICLSKEMVQNVLSLCCSVNGKIVVIPNELMPKNTKVFFGNLMKRVIIGCAAAHLNEKKGIANLLYMVSEFKKISDIEIKLELVGRIDTALKNNYIQITDSLDLKDNVEFKSHKTREQLQLTIQKWDFYVQTSVCEGHPNSITESLQQGTAFISSKTGYISECLCAAHPYFFFESWDPSVMANNLKQIINLKNKEELYTQAYNLLSKSCCKETIYEKWQSLLSYNTSCPTELGIEHVITLALHDVSGELHDSITTPKNVFIKFVEFVYQQGWQLCSMRDYLKMNTNERKRSVVCTFDDGYKNLVEVVLPILSHYKYTATVFVCTGLIGKDNKWNNKDATLRMHLDHNGIKNLIKGGWEIASHGVTHRNLLKLSDDEIEYELSMSKQYLDRLVGYSTTYAYPYGAFNKFIQRCVQKYFRYAFAVNQGGTSILVDNMQIRRYSITDIYQMIPNAE